MREYSAALCSICQCEASGYGYLPPRRERKKGEMPPIAHSCTDLECLDLAKDSYDMRQEEFTRLEELATEEGGNEAGAFLESIGKAGVPLMELTPDEWSQFCHKLVAGYRKSLKEHVKHNTPPF